MHKYSQHLEGKIPSSEKENRKSPQKWAILSLYQAQTTTTATATAALPPTTLAKRQYRAAASRHVGSQCYLEPSADLHGSDHHSQPIH